MLITIDGFTITRFSFPRKRVIGDSQVKSDWHHIGALELHASNGCSGLGFFRSLFVPLPPLVELYRLFEQVAAQQVIGHNPFGLVHRVTRKRGRKQQVDMYDEAVNQALWDVVAKTVQMPLYRLLGGRQDRVRVYGSPLGFHLDDDAFCLLLQRGMGMGFRAHKIKVGHPDVAWDIARLQLARQTVGEDALLMADANEAWSPKEAVRRLHAFKAAGITLYWIEDPCLRDDFSGLREIRRAAPFTHVNSGEYLKLHGKRKLLEAAGADILNIHGNFSDGLRAGWLAAEFGLPVSVGNTLLELGVHLATALPEVDWMEFSFPSNRHLVDDPIQFVDGHAVAPDRPGHGLVLSQRAREELAKAES